MMLPGIDGYRCAGSCGNGANWTPVFMLTARDGERDEVEALDTGADDYLTKPFSYAVLVARLRALLRRGARERPPCSPAGDLRMDPAARSALARGSGGRADGPRAGAAGVSAAPPRGGGVQARDPGPRVGLRLRGRPEHRRGVRPPPAQQARPAVRAGKRSRPCVAAATGWRPTVADPRRSGRGLALGSAAHDRGSPLSWSVWPRRRRAGAARACLPGFAARRAGDLGPAAGRSSWLEELAAGADPRTGDTEDSRGASSFDRTGRVIASSPNAAGLPVLARPRAGRSRRRWRCRSTRAASSSCAEAVGPRRRFAHPAGRGEHRGRHRNDPAVRRRAGRDRAAGAAARRRRDHLDGGRPNAAPRWRRSAARWPPSPRPSCTGASPTRPATTRSAGWPAP